MDKTKSKLLSIR